MSKRIGIIHGHPDPDPQRFGFALTEAYSRGAIAAGFEIKHIIVADLDFPVLRTKADFDDIPPVECIRQAQQIIAWADHLLIIYPLWLGTLPAYLQAFFEQVLRPNFTFGRPDENITSRKKPLTGKTAHVVVTMGMPVWFYRWFFCSHGLKNFHLSVLAYCGIKPIKNSLIGKVDDADSTAREQWLTRMLEYGSRGE